MNTKKMNLTKKVQILLACFSLTLLFACKENVMDPSPDPPLPGNTDTIPSAPQNLKVFVLGQTSVQLKWQAPVGLGKPVMTKYLIYRSIGNGAAENIEFVNYGSSTSLTNLSLTNSTPYKYYITAVNANGESEKSNTVEAIPHKLGTEDYLYALSFVGSELYVGGDFFSIGGNSRASNISKWNGSAWSEFTTNPTDLIFAIADNETDVYIGGYFTNLGARIAQRVGNGWIPLGNGVGTGSEFVSSILVDGNNLYVGGNFTQAGGNTSIDYFARWNGSVWSEPGAPGIGTATSNRVNAIVKSGDDIILGGTFQIVGSTLTENIAIYKSSTNSFTAMGLGLNGTVHSVAAGGNVVYAGGNFTNSGGTNNPMNRFAKFEGSWVNLGSAISSGTVYTIAVNGNDVYIGGNFTSPGNRIAKWNGTAWSTLGTGVNGTVRSIVINGNDVYVGGEFTSAGDRPAGSIAKWDGTDWHGF